MNGSIEARFESGSEEGSELRRRNNRVGIGSERKREKLCRNLGGGERHCFVICEIGMEREKEKKRLFRVSIRTNKEKRGRRKQDWGYSLDM